jgi:nicotinamidase-related amidase
VESKSFYISRSDYFFLFLHNRINALAKIRRARPGQRFINALLIVDVQYDFIDGSLALKNCPSQHQGEQVIPVINRLLTDIQFDVVAYTQDWHPSDHISFYGNLHLRSHLLADDSKPADELKLFDTAVFLLDDKKSMKKERVEQILWPAHCVQQSHGAELHRDLMIVKPTRKRKVINLLKGFDKDIDSYSAFWDNQKVRETLLNSKLKEYNVTQVFIVGLATDVCVFSTAMHSVENGYSTFIVEDGCRGVDETNIGLRLDELINSDCAIIQSTDVKDLI